MTTVWHPGELLSTSSAYWRGCTLQAGVRLKVFSALAGGRHSAETVAETISGEARATGLLLDALAAMGLLSKQGDRYENSTESERFLVESSPEYMGYIILHHHHLVDGWVQLDSAVESGGAVQRRSYGADIERESFIMGMFSATFAFVFSFQIGSIANGVTAVVLFALYLRGWLKWRRGALKPAG